MFPDSLRLLCVTMLAGLALAATSGAQCKTRPDDRTAMVDAVRVIFDAAKHDDLAKFHSVTTKDFYAFDNGKRFDGDALMALIQQAHAQGKVYDWNVTEPVAYVSCNTALVTYVNRGSLKDGSGTKDLSWLESASLVREGASWRVRFLHSSRMAP